MEGEVEDGGREGRRYKEGGGGGGGRQERVAWGAVNETQVGGWRA